jgi:Flp pilus assembly protein TadD
MQMLSTNLSGALQSVQKSMATNVKPDISAPFLALELLGRGVKDAETLVTQALTNQDKPDYPMAYVRVLIEAKRFELAAEQALSVTQRFPTHAEAWLLLGSLQFEQGQDKQADASLQTYILSECADIFDFDLGDMPFFSIFFSNCKYIHSYRYCYCYYL